MEDHVAAHDRARHSLGVGDIADRMLDGQPFERGQAGAGAPQHPHRMAARQQRRHQVCADKAGAASYKNFHLFSQELSYY